MQRPVVRRDARRFAVAAAAVSRSLRADVRPGRVRTVGLPGIGSGAPGQLVPVGPGGAEVNGVPRRDATVRALGAVRPSGNTPLYRAIVDGVAALSPADPGRIDALVVLTDGEDHGSGMTAAAMVTAVRGTGVRVFVVAIGEASCGAPAIRDVTRVTAGGCVQASPGDLDAELRRAVPPVVGRILMSAGASRRVRVDGPARRLVGVWPAGSPIGVAATLLATTYLVPALAPGPRAGSRARWSSSAAPTTASAASDRR